MVHAYEEIVMFRNWSGKNRTEFIQEKCNENYSAL